MSTTIDQRVVEMRFDNQHFEKNVSNTMSTLDKLKQKLNLSGASKGLESIDSAAKKVNMNGLGTAVETVTARFSALQVMGVTALANITNSAVNAGKRIVESLTIAPIKEGFSEYEMTLNAIQTTMAATGKTSAQVQEELKKLDEYADKTVYSTADMLNNLPKFTNAGVELETATKAMIGIANATALAGGDAGKASIAFYNLGQAIGTGYLTRMDYNSINNAGIATMEWKNQMVEAAIAQGTLTKVGEDAYKAGNKTLTLQQLFIDGLQEQWATTDVMLEVFGKYGDELDESVGKKAYAAAQDIKTFSMMMESLKATAGTGWKDTWQLIFGDLEEAKVLWTGLNNFISGIITKMADLRNGILESALGKGFTSLSKSINKIVGPSMKAVEVVKKTTDTLADFDEVVNQVIRGEWNIGQTRWDALTKAGYNWCKVQNKVNEEMGCSFRYTEEQIAAAEKLINVQGESTKELKGHNEAIKENSVATEAQIEALKELGAQAEKLGIPLDDFIDNLDQISGRWLLINSIKNIGKGIIDVFNAMKTAWQEVFPPKSIEERGEQIFNLISAFHKLTSNLVGVIYQNGELTKTGKKLVRTFEGIFAVIDLITTVAGGAFKIAFKVLSEVLGYFDLDILDVTAHVADVVIGFRDWVDSVLDIGAALEVIIPYIEKAIDAAKKWFKAIKASDIVQGLVNGLVGGIGAVWDAAVALAKSIVDAIKSFLGIHSPSTVMIAIGGWLIAGLIIGLQNGAPELWSKIKTVFGDIISKIYNFFKDADLGTLLAMGGGVAVMTIITKFSKALGLLASPLVQLGGMFDSIGDGVETFLKGLGANFKANAWEKRGKAMLSFAGAIAILAGSLYLLTKIDDKGDLWNAVGAIAALAVIIGGLSAALGKWGSSNPLKVAGLGIAMIGLGAAVLMMASALKKVSEIEGDLDTAISAVAQITFLVAGLALIAKIPTNAGKLGGTMIKLGLAMLLMIGVVKLISTVTDAELNRATGVIEKFILFVGAVALANLASGKYVNKIGGTMIKLGIALALMVGVVKLINMLTDGEINKAVDVIGKYLIFVAAIALLSAIPGTAKIGGSLLGVTVALAVMVGTVKLINTLTQEEIDKAVDVIGKYLIFVAAIALISAIPGASKIGLTMLTLSIAIGILAGVVALIGLLNPEHLKKGLTAVGLLGLVMTAMILATKGANDCKGNLIVMTVAIGLMVAAVAALSLIDQTKLAGATIAMTVLMGMFAIMTKVSGQAQSAMGGLIMITGVVVILAGILYLLSGLPVDSTLAVAASLSVLMLSLSVSLRIISGISAVSPMALVAVGAMVVVMGLLGGLLWLLQDLPVDTTIAVALSLSVFLIAMSVALAILTVVGAAAPAALAGVGVLSLLIVALGLLLADIDEFLVGATDNLPTVADNLSNFMSRLQPFLDAVNGLDEGFTTKIGSLVDGIATLAKTELLTTLTSWLPGSDDSLTNFASQLKTFGSALADFAAETAGVNSESIAGSVGAAKKLMEVAGSIPSDGLLGTDGIDDFGRNIVTFGKKMKQYGDEVADIDAASITASVSAARGLVNVAKLIPDDGAIGTDGIDDFGKNIKSFGKSLAKYSDEVSDVDSGAVSSSVASVRKIIGVMNALGNVDTSGVDGFKKAINSLAKTNFDGFVKTFSASAKDLSSVGADMINSIVKGMKSKQSSFKANGATLVNTLVQGVTMRIPTFSQAGIKMMTEFVKAINSQKSKVTNAAKSAASSAPTAVRTQYSGMYTAGRYLGEGLVNGINSKKTAVYNAAYQLGRQAVLGEKAGQKSKSPSKATIQAGHWFGEGLVIGIGQMTHDVYSAGANLGKEATNSLSSTISRLSDVMASDIDVQPTIRPVLDLTDVKTGAGALGDMLGIGSIGLSGVNSISSMMSRRGQNGGNSDVVSAIDKLRKELGNVGNTSYNINGITYDRGSELDDAFRTIVRYAKIEGRV